MSFVEADAMEQGQAHHLDMGDPARTGGRRGNEGDTLFRNATVAVEGSRLSQNRPGERGQVGGGKEGVGERGTESSTTTKDGKGQFHFSEKPRDRGAREKK